VFDEIRRLFATLPDARLHGYKPGRFSFNVKGGRCEACQGDGVRQIEMHFLPDVYVRCEECNGKRFNEATLRVRYKGKSIAEVLELTVREASELFAAHSSWRAARAALRRRPRLSAPGQPSPTLSGGEAQRIKLARELAQARHGPHALPARRADHRAPLRRRAQAPARARAARRAGNSVVVIEHNLDVIKTADWVIDLGPEGGPDGGRIVACGTPEAVAHGRARTRAATSRRSSARRPRARRAAIRRVTDVARRRGRLARARGAPQRARRVLAARARSRPIRSAATAHRAGGGLDARLLEEPRLRRDARAPVRPRARARPAPSASRRCSAASASTHRGPRRAAHRAARAARRGRARRRPRRHARRARRAGPLHAFAESVREGRWTGYSGGGSARS
jgi:hypothetical protein